MDGGEIQQEVCATPRSGRRQSSRRSRLFHHGRSWTDARTRVCFLI